MHLAFRTTCVAAPGRHYDDTCALAALTLDFTVQIQYDLCLAGAPVPRVENFGIELTDPAGGKGCVCV